MLKFKSKTGITLVALIITIIVLLILAVVAIKAVSDDGIINYAKNASNQYEAKKIEESDKLKNYAEYIENKISDKKEDNVEDKIQLTVNGIACYAEKNGTIWMDWIASEYNTIGVYVDDEFLCVALDGKEVHESGNQQTIYPASESGITIDDGDVYVLGGIIPV